MKTKAEEAIAYHKELHAALDSLVACWIEGSPPDKTRLPSEHTIMDLMRWSHQQTVDPSCGKI